MMAWQDLTLERRIEGEVAAMVEAAMAGDLSRRIAVADDTSFLDRLGAGINELLDVSERTVRNDWQVARVWLWRELRDARS